MTLTEARCEPKPVQRPHPPITIGGSGRKRTLRTTARWAQQWNSLAAGARRSGWSSRKYWRRTAPRRQGRQRDHLLGQHPVRQATWRTRVAQASMYRDAGVDLIIVNLPHHAKPEALQPLADALEQLA